LQHIEIKILEQGSSGTYVIGTGNDAYADPTKTERFDLQLTQGQRPARWVSPRSIVDQLVSEAYHPTQRINVRGRIVIPLRHNESQKTTFRKD
jgi:hypothetical protein